MGGPRDDVADYANDGSVIVGVDYEYGSRTFVLNTLLCDSVVHALTQSVVRYVGVATVVAGMQTVELARSILMHTIGVGATTPDAIGSRLSVATTLMVVRPAVVGVVIVARRQTVDVLADSDQVIDRGSSQRRVSLVAKSTTDVCATRVHGRVCGG